KKKWTIKKLLYIASAAGFLVLVTYIFLSANERQMKVQSDRLQIATVQNGDFQEFIPVTGNIQPIKTFFLDAIEGGIIQSIVKESGEMVIKGDVLLTLNNTNLQLSVLSQQSQLYEQINNIKTTRLAMDQNTRNLEADLADIDYQLSLSKPEYERQKELLASKATSQKEYEQAKDNYEYQIKRKALTYASFVQDSLIKDMQREQLDASENRLWESLSKVGKLVDNLVIKATIDGQYAAPELEIGQSISSGERLGQIDNIDAFKVRVHIDELYLPRVRKGQTGKLNFQNKNYELRITKIYPTIKEGQFEADMEFLKEEPNDITRGQTMRMRLELDKPKKALLLPSGGFFQKSGGRYVFVLDESGNKAYKKEIRLGRKNPAFYEVLEGLNPGDQVITSDYDSFGDNEVLLLNK
ncbi:efflux RND transporter periplasmic adaptor subunit, partial [Xanthovirga aplysinae]|uniref:efflux RND transporter periplasmic adaptor subunit n=1 Tax=Xanthovirga aplysinae TaxID=2529853 RepID=UPI0012BCA56B